MDHHTKRDRYRSKLDSKPCEVLSDRQSSPRHFILIPGLFEPRFAFFPLKQSLSKQAEHVEYWCDRYAFRNLEMSINALAAAIAGDADQEGEIGIVTHSFGDWIARAAIARSLCHRVTAMVSLAPVMRAGFLTTLLYGLTGNMIPEIRVIMNRNTASANLDCDDRIRRLVIWSRFEESLRSVPLEGIQNLQVQRIWATHFSITWQSNVTRVVHQFMLDRCMPNQDSTSNP